MVANIRAVSRFISTIVIPLTASACVAVYKPPQDISSVASLSVDQSQFTSGAFSTPNVEWFYAYTDDTCSSNNGGIFAGLGRYQRGADTILLKAQQRAFIKATFSGIEHNILPLGSFYQKLCTNVVSFVPESGHKYIVLQTPDTLQCSMVVREDNSENTIPASFMTHPVSSGCTVGRY